MFLLAYTWKRLGAHETDDGETLGEFCSTKHLVYISRGVK